MRGERMSHWFQKDCHCRGEAGRIKPERLRGYIVKYMIKQPVSAGFGFIVPEEELEAHLEDKEGTVYFKQTDIDCETMPKRIPKVIITRFYIPVYPAWQDMREGCEDRRRTFVSGEKSQPLRRR